MNCIPSGTWRVGYPSPADFNFDFSRLLRDTRHAGIAKNARPDLRVAIVGAGIAGLTAAHELFRCGVTNLDIYEASERIGGRLRSEPVEGQHTVFELGAMRIPMFTQPTGPAAVFAQYTQRFGVTSQPFPTADTADVSFGVYSERATAFNLKAGGGILPVAPEVESVRQKWELFASRVVTAVRASFGTPQWPAFWHAFEQRYWRDSFRNVMLTPARAQDDRGATGKLGGAGMSEDELCVLERAGIGEGPWAAYLDFSAMLVFRMLFFGFFDDLQLIQGRFDADGDHAGGPHAGDTSLTDSLGNSLAAPRYLGVQSVAEAMLYFPVESEHIGPISVYDASRDDRYRVRLYTRSAVQSIMRVEDEVRIECSSHQRYYDAVLLTAPMAGNRCGIRMIGFTDGELPPDVVGGDRMSEWLASSKVYVALKARYWEKSNIPQLIAADNFLEATYGYAVRTPRISDPGVLLLSYTWDKLSESLLSEANDTALVSRCIAMLDQMLRQSGIGGKMSDYVDEGQSAVIHWFRQPTIRGAGRMYRAGFAQPNHALLRYNEAHSAMSKLYLAGEAYAIDGGWVESAMRMSLDAVLHLLRNHDAAFSAPFTFDSAYPQRSTERFTL
ncbi:flavin monoamine oxidase family protein [Paraburkholderia rhizosphaerae]|nr:NAD(P)/FAD-dependent oxidoreductase [Paraburkholderia rhizosphaerae]